MNATGTGDETQRIDNDLGNESIQFSFNLAGTFDKIDLRYIEESSNEGTLHFAKCRVPSLELSSMYRKSILSKVPARLKEN